MVLKLLPAGGWIGRLPDDLALKRILADTEVRGQEAQQRPFIPVTAHRYPLNEQLLDVFGQG